MEAWYLFAFVLNAVLASDSVGKRKWGWATAYILFAIYSLVMIAVETLK